MALVCPRLFTIVVVAMGTHCGELFEIGDVWPIFSVFTHRGNIFMSGSGLTRDKGNYCKLIINFYNLSIYRFMCNIFSF